MLRLMHKQLNLRVIPLQYVCRNVTRLKIVRSNIAQCVQGQCRQPPSNAPVTVKPGQCLLTTSEGLFGWYSQDAADDVWLESLVLHTEAENNTVLYWGPTSLQSQLWLTSVTTSGAGQGLYSHASAVYAEGVALRA